LWSFHGDGGFESLHFPILGGHLSLARATVVEMKLLFVPLTLCGPVSDSVRHMFYEYYGRSGVSLEEAAFSFAVALTNRSVLIL
jgi:hypothetical protein